MGLAWKSIASSGAEPFWQTLASSGAWDEPVMTFQITRFTNISQVRTLEPGGTFTMGALNSSLYTGAIDYVDLPSDAVTYWTLPLTCKYTSFIQWGLPVNIFNLSVDCSREFDHSGIREGKLLCHRHWHDPHRWTPGRY